jgi:hypothetical protein
MCWYINLQHCALLLHCFLQVLLKASHRLPLLLCDVRLPEACVSLDIQENCIWCSDAFCRCFSCSGPATGCSYIAASICCANTTSCLRDRPLFLPHVTLQVLQLLKASHRPLLLLGGGAVHVDASLLGELVDVLDMPVVYTWMGKVGAQCSAVSLSVHVPRCVCCLGVLDVPVVYTWMGKVGL